jgi:hypothetical protein
MGMALGLLQAEEKDLGAIYAALDEAERADREANQDQVSDILDDARMGVRHIMQRRMAFGQELGKLTPGAAPATAPPGPGAPAAEATPTPSNPAERIGQMLDKLRQMTAEQYEAARTNLAQGLIATLLDFGPPASAAQAGKPLTPEEQKQATLARERIREKLYLAHRTQTALQQAQRPVPATVGETLRAARQDLWANLLPAAETKVNAALRDLGVLPPEEKPPFAQ